LITIDAAVAALRMREKRGLGVSFVLTYIYPSTRSWPGLHKTGHIFRAILVLNGSRDVFLQPFPRLVNFGPSGPPGVPKFEVGKNFFLTFLIHHLAVHDEIWHDDGHWSTGLQ